uniref:Zinc finger and BTB domain containing 49 n=1 Tax=Cyprinus carpio TaxID=7962 RepID=A0A8C2ARV8_CYPCA
MDSVSSHSVYVLQQLQEQRIQGLLCDCMLVVKGVCFKAHKNVLAAFSAYFRSLFQNSPAQKSDVFHLAIQDVGGIGQVLDYMYTSHLELNQDNVHALLEIGQSLQVLNILNMCQAFLKPCVSTDASLSLPADAAHYQDCVLGGSLPSDADLHKPLPHGYKLRNFYTRQYLKQSCSFPPEEPLQSSVPAADSAHPCSSDSAHPSDSTHPCGTGSTHPFSVCFSFAASGDVQRHIIIHSGARPHLCDICGRGEESRADLRFCPTGFSNFSNLKEHKKTHSTEEEFTCEQCGKSFNMQRKLFKHKLRHSGDKPYSCQTCGKCFAGSGDLQRHVRSHTGERPYTCDTCGKSFTRTAVLRRHRSSHCSRADADASSPAAPHTSASCRSTEELSSGALWGRAMKTLQNHTDTEH